MRGHSSPRLIKWDLIHKIGWSIFLSLLHLPEYWGWASSCVWGELLCYTAQMLPCANKCLSAPQEAAPGPAVQCWEDNKEGEEDSDFLKCTFNCTKFEECKGKVEQEKWKWGAMRSDRERTKRYETAGEVVREICWKWVRNAGREGERAEIRQAVI